MIQRGHIITVDEDLGDVTDGDVLIRALARNITAGFGVDTVSGAGTDLFSPGGSPWQQNGPGHTAARWRAVNRFRPCTCTRETCCT